jgi:hypothetical protein
MCKELPLILVNRVKRIIGKMEEEERHKGPLTPRFCRNRFRAVTRGHRLDCSLNPSALKVRRADTKQAATPSGPQIYRTFDLKTGSVFTNVCCCHGDQIGRFFAYREFFSVGTFLKTTKNLTKTGFGYIWDDFFTSSAGHPACSYLKNYRATLRDSTLRPLSLLAETIPLDHTGWVLFL